MNATARFRIEMFSAYCGALYIVTVLTGWGLLAGFVPPIPPATTPEQISALFQEDPLRIRLGMIIAMFSALVFIPFAALIAHYLRRIENGLGVLSGAALLGGAGNMVLTFYPPIWWLTALYRPDRGADLIYLINDAAWLQFIGGVSMFYGLPLSVAVAAFCDKSAKPVFPRWAGFFNILVVLLILPDQLLFFFHSGPFAWSGLFGFWAPLTMFGSWFIVHFLLMREAILREREQRIPDTSQADTLLSEAVAIKPKT